MGPVGEVHLHTGGSRGIPQGHQLLAALLHRVGQDILEHEAPGVLELGGPVGALGGFGIGHLQQFIGGARI